MPTIIEGSFGFPTTVAKLHRGASSPERPTFEKPVPQSITTAYVIIQGYLFTN